MAPFPASLTASQSPRIGVASIRRRFEIHPIHTRLPRPRPRAVAPGLSLRRSGEASVIRQISFAERQICAFNCQKIGRRRLVQQTPRARRWRHCRLMREIAREAGLQAPNAGENDVTLVDANMATAVRRDAEAGFVEENLPLVPHPTAFDRIDLAAFHGMALVLMACGLAIAVAGPALAKGGGFLHLFPSQSPPVARAGVPTPQLPPASDLLSGCGHGRYRDAATHRCRGPADIGN